MKILHFPKSSRFRKSSNPPSTAEQLFLASLYDNLAIPTTIAALKAIAKKGTASLSGEVLHAVMQNFQKCAEVCFHCKGRHFEYALECF